MEFKINCNLCEHENVCRYNEATEKISVGKELADIEALEGATNLEVTCKFYKCKSSGIVWNGNGYGYGINSGTAADITPCVYTSGKQEDL